MNFDEFLEIFTIYSDLTHHPKLIQLIKNELTIEKYVDEVLTHTKVRLTEEEKQLEENMKINPRFETNKEMKDSLIEMIKTHIKELENKLKLAEYYKNQLTLPNSSTVSKN